MVDGITHEGLILLLVIVLFFKLPNIAKAVLHASQVWPNHTHSTNPNISISLTLTLPFATCVIMILATDVLLVILSLKFMSNWIITPIY